LEGFEQCGDGVRDAVEEGPAFAVAAEGRRALRLPAGSRRYLGFGLAFLFFQEFPVAEDLGGGFCSDIAEDVGMATNHFVVDFADDVGDGEAAGFGGDLGVEENLEEEVAEFLGEFGVVARVEGVENFVGFLDEVGAEGGVGLFAIPGAAAGGAKAGHDGG